MTDKREPSDSKYKQVLFKGRYSNAKIGEDDYMQTSVWKDLRAARMKLDHFRCANPACMRAYNLEVHHTRYPQVWGEEDVERDLVTLCDNCHEWVHGNG